MTYYSERNGLRTKNNKSYKMSMDAYNLILQTCEEMFVHLAWKFSLTCPDNDSNIVNIDRSKLYLKLKFLNPDLIKNDALYYPMIHRNYFGDDEIDEFNPYALFDLIEYICENAMDFEKRDHHSYFQHYHLKFKDSNECVINFRNEINELFDITNLLYELDSNYEVQRVVSNDSQLEATSKLVSNTNDDTLKKLINEAISYYRKPGTNNIQIATEKIWDAFERIKTKLDEDKKKSVTKLISIISDSNDDFNKLLDTEFKSLTNIGNQFCIRHFETGKIELKDENQYEYLFNRCLSVVLLSLKYIDHHQIDSSTLQRENM